MSTRQALLSSALGFAVLAAPSGARAADVFWAAATNGSWTVASNWSPAVVPGASDTAHIAVDGTYTVTLSSSATVAKLVVGGTTGTQTLLVSSSTITLNGASTIGATGALRLATGTVSGAGAVDNQGLIYASGGVCTLNAPLTTAVGSTIRIAAVSPFGGSTLTAASGFTNNGTIVMSNDHVIAVDATLNVTSGILTNAPGATMSIEAGAGGLRTLGARLDNQGTVNVLRALTIAKASADHANSGTIDVSGGNLTITQTVTTPSFTNTGTIDVDPARTLSVSGGVFDQPAGSLGGGGSALFTNVTSSLQTALGISSLTMSGSTVTLGVPLATATTVLSLSGNSTLNGATVTNSAGRTLSIASSTINNAVQNEGLIHSQGNTGTLNGAITTAVGSTIRVATVSPFGGATLTAASGFTNNGTIVLSNDHVIATSATLNVTSGILTNAPGATMSIESGEGGLRTLGARLDNQGTVNVLQALAIAKASADHANSGTINVSGGNLTITQTGTTPSFTNTGTIDVDPARTLSVSGGVFDQLAGSLGGGGSAALTSVTASMQTALGVSSLTMSGSTVTLGVPLATATTVLSLSNNSTLSGATVTNSAGRTLAIASSTINNAVLNEGTIHAQGNTSSLNGALTTAVGSTVRVATVSPFGGSTLTAASGFTNNGAIVLGNDHVIATDATLNVTSGILTNAPGATMSIEAGAGGVRTLGARLDNQGTLTIDQALTIAKASADHANSGTIDVGPGNLTLTQTGTTPSFTNTGTIDVDPARTLSVSGGAFDQLAGSLSGGGSALFTNVTASIQTALGIASLTMSGSTVTLGVPLATATTVLSLSGNSTLNGALVTNSAGRTLAIASSTINNAVQNEGLVHAQGNTSTFNGALTTAAGSTLRVATVTPFGGSTLTAASGFTNNGTIVLSNDHVIATDATLNVTSGILTNAPGATMSIEAGAGGTRTLGARLDNQGTVNVIRALTIAKASADHVNSGTIDVSGGDLTLTQTGTTPSFTNTGTIDVDPARTLSVSGGVFDQLAGSLGGGGSASLTNVTSSMQTALGVSSLTMNGSTVTLAVPLATATTALSLSNNSTLSGAMVTNSAGRTLSISTSTINNAVQNEGLVHAQGNTSTFNGALTTAAGSTIRVAAASPFGASTLTAASGFTNNGTIVLSNDQGFITDATLNVTSGVLTNSAGATMSIEAGGGGTRTLGAQLDNQGMLTIAQALTVAKSSADHANSGTIDVSGGNLTLTQTGTTPSFTNQGLLRIAAGRTAAAGGGTIQNAPDGRILGAGTLVVSTSAFTNAGSIEPGASPGTLTLTGGMTSLPTSLLRFELGGYSPGAQFDRLVASGAVSLAGDIDVALVDGFIPSLGDSFVVLSSSSLSGSFSCLRGTEIGGGLAIEPRVRSAALVLAVVASTSANLPPTGINDGGVTAFDTPIVIPILANDSDPDGDSIFVRSIDTTGTAGSAVLDPGGESITFTPLLLFLGQDTLRYTIGDCQGGSDVALVIVNVGPATGVDLPHDSLPAPPDLPIDTLPAAPTIAALEFAARPGAGGGADLVLALPREADVEIELFDLQGRRIGVLEAAHMPAGRHVLSWNGARHASGIYFARLLARTDSESVRRNVRVLSIR